jgi:hypothetical protein
MNLPSVVVSAAVLDAAKMCEESRNVELSFSSTPSVDPATYIKTTTSIATILQPLLQLGCELKFIPSLPPCSLFPCWFFRGTFGGLPFYFFSTLVSLSTLGGCDYTSQILVFGYSGASLS